MLRLQSIASLEMGRLNEKLIDNAAQLRCEQLIEYLDAILEAITSGAKSSNVANLQARVSHSAACVCSLFNCVVCTIYVSASMIC